MKNLKKDMNEYYDHIYEKKQSKWLEFTTNLLVAGLGMMTTVTGVMNGMGYIPKSSIGFASVVVVGTLVTATAIGKIQHG